MARSVDQNPIRLNFRSQASNQPWICSWQSGFGGIFSSRLRAPRKLERYMYNRSKQKLTELILLFVKQDINRSIKVKTLFIKQSSSNELEIYRRRPHCDVFRPPRSHPVDLRLPGVPGLHRPQRGGRGSNQQRFGPLAVGQRRMRR